MLPHQKGIRKSRPIIVLTGRHQACLGAAGVPYPASAGIIHRRAPRCAPAVRIIIAALIIIALRIAHPISQHALKAQQCTSPADPVLIIAALRSTRVLLSPAKLFSHHLWGAVRGTQTGPLIVPAVCIRTGLVAVAVQLHFSAAAWGAVEVAGIVPYIFAGSYIAGRGAIRGVQVFFKTAEGAKTAGIVVEGTGLA